MSITFGAISAAVTGSGAAPVLSPTDPGGSTADSLCFLVVGWKSSSIATPTIATSGDGSWTLLQIADSVTDIGSGVDTGSTTMGIWYKKGTVPTGTTATFVGTVGACQSTIGYYNITAGSFWGLASTGGTDETYGADYSAVLTNNNVGAKTGDIIAVFNMINTDAGSPTGITMTSSGATYTPSSRLGSPSATGDDSRVSVYDFSVSGTQSANNMTFGYTNASSSQGATLAVRMRELVPPTITITPIAPFGETAGYEVQLTDMGEYQEFSISRDQGKGAEELRGGYRQSVTSPTITFEDFEFTFGYSDAASSPPVSYTVTLWHSGLFEESKTTARVNTPLQDWTASVASEGAGPKTWLSCPLIPDINIPVLVQSYKEYDREARVLSEAHVLGRKNPVASLDVLGGRKGALAFLIPTDDYAGAQYVPQDIRTYEQTLEQGDIYLLRILNPYRGGVEDLYFYINSIKVKRLNEVVNMFDGEPQMVIEIQYTECDAPPVQDVNPIVDWNDVLNNSQYIGYSYGWSWRAVKDLNGTWLDVLLDA